MALEDSIGAHVSDLPSAWRGVTVHQLLNHTSGIPSYADKGPAWVKRWGEEMTSQTIVSLTADDMLNFPTGTKFRYNNTGYVLLGMLLEAKEGKAWWRVLDERLLKPLGLADTRWCATGPIIPRRAAGYAPGGTPYRNAPYLAMSQPHAAGAVYGTVGDLVRWQQALHGGKVVSAESYRRMTTPDGAAAEAGYAFGIGRRAMGNTQVLTHTGGISGFTSVASWVPEHALGVVVRTNVEGPAAGELHGTVLRAALGLPPEAPAAKP